MRSDLAREGCLFGATGLAGDFHLSKQGKPACCASANVLESDQKHMNVLVSGCVKLCQAVHFLTPGPWVWVVMLVHVRGGSEGRWIGNNHPRRNMSE